MSNVSPISSEAVRPFEPAANEDSAHRSFLVQLKNGPNVRDIILMMAPNRRAAEQSCERYLHRGEYCWAEEFYGEVDAAYARDKQSGALEARRHHRLIEAQQQYLEKTGRL